MKLGPQDGVKDTRELVPSMCHVRKHKEGGYPTARRELSRELNCAGTSISNFQLPELLGEFLLFKPFSA